MALLGSWTATDLNTGLALAAQTHRYTIADVESLASSAASTISSYQASEDSSLSQGTAGWADAFEEAVA